MTRVPGKVVFVAARHVTRGSSSNWAGGRSAALVRDQGLLTFKEERT